MRIYIGIEEIVVYIYIARLHSRRIWMNGMLYLDFNRVESKYFKI
jgi:hypothetical protein